ncbi:hypothetical protein GN956_G15741 [Arapaima gigas]
MTSSVTLCSNSVQVYSLALVVDVQGVGKEVLALPIHARCVVPKVHLDTPLLELQRCFLSYPYQKCVRLINDGDLPACYGLLSQDFEKQPSLVYSSSHPRGILQPHEEVEIPLVLQAKTLGKLQVTARAAVFGSEEPPLEVILSCTGEGPVVHVTVTAVNFGNIPVLTDVFRTVQLLNQSPIPASFQAQMVCSRSQFHVEPFEGEVPPDGELQLRLVAHLDDTAHFQDKLHLAILYSHTYSIPVSASGKGTTIVSNRPFAPHLDLGTHFSASPYRYHFRLTNQGRRFHQLYWMTEGFSPFCRRTLPPPHSNSSRGDGKRGLSNAPESDGPVFILEPPYVELAPGQTADMVLVGFSKTSKVVQERLVCQAILGHKGGKERIMTVEVKCLFVSPVLDFSSPELSFYAESIMGVSLVPLYQPLTLTNVSSLPLSMELTLAKPFGLCDPLDNRSFVMTKILTLGVGQDVKLWVSFDPLYWQDSTTHVAEEVLEIHYQDHPQRDSIRLRGEVRFPNLRFSSTSLDFGCILNYSESQKQLTMTNCSRLAVMYRWAFLVDQVQYHIR